MEKRSRRKKAIWDGVSLRFAVADAGAPRLPLWSGRDWLWGLILILAVILAYQPVGISGYVWDDSSALTGNSCIVGPLGLKEIWTTSAADICPLTLTTFWIEDVLWGLAPLPYHLMNVLLHGACAVVLWRVLLSLRVPGAWLGAALWALHPMQVESVAWIAEMKNTESGLFFLLSVLFFMRWLKTRDLDERTGSDWSYGLTLLFAALAMAAKSSTVILPVVFGLCAWWMEGRWQWRNLARLAPIFLFSIAAGAVSLWTQGRQLATPGDFEWTRTWPERLVASGDAVWFYLAKLLWPYPLMAVYPRWQIDAGWWGSYPPLLAVMIVLFILWLKRESWSRPWFFAFAYFLVALLPGLGLLDNTIFRFSLVFAHFQYLAGMGPLALAAAGFFRLVNGVITRRPGLQSAFAGGILAVLGILSWQRAWAFESDETLWTDTLAKNPNCWVGYNNLGNFYLQKGWPDKAMGLYQKSLELNPNYDMAHNNIGNVLFQMGRMKEAIVHYQKAVAINPNYVVALNDLGFALCLNGQVDEAIAEYQKVLEMEPEFAEAHNNLGFALYKKGQMDKATAEYQKSLELMPNNAQAHYNFGWFLFQEEKLDDGMAQFQKALEIDPVFPQAHDNLGSAFIQKGQLDDAVVQFQEALRLNSADSHAQSNLAKVEAMIRQRPASSN